MGCLAHDIKSLPMPAFLGLEYPSKWMHLKMCKKLWSVVDIQVDFPFLLYRQLCEELVYR